MRWPWRLLLVVVVFAVGVAGGVRWLGSSGPALDPTATPTIQRTTQPDSTAPRIELVPNVGYAGTRIQVQGAGWPASAMVIVVLEDAAGRSDVLAASAANDAGELRTSFAYPAAERWLRADTQTVVAYTADETIEVTAQFELIASDEVVQASITPTASPAISATNTVPSVTVTHTATTAPTPTPAAPATPTTTPTTTPTITPSPTVLVVQGWLGEYWNNPDLSGAPVLQRDDAAVQFAWGASSPAHAVQADGFSARWTRTVEFDEGLYRFALDVDDGARLYIDGQLVLDAWTGGPHRPVTVERALRAGPHRIRLAYHEVTGPALVALRWERVTPPTPTRPPTATPSRTPTPTAPSTVPPAATPVVFSIRVTEGRDDAEQEADGSINLNSDELDMVDHEESDGSQIVGVRFQNVPVPSGATVTNAYIEFTAEEPADAPTTLHLQGQAAGDAPRFTRDRNDIGRRARTAAAVEWTGIPPWQTPGEQQRTPDLTPIVQEIVNRDDWRSGHALVFIITGSGQRLAETYDESPDAAPRLVVAYRPPAAP